MKLYYVVQKDGECSVKELGQIKDETVVLGPYFSYGQAVNALNRVKVCA